MKFSLKTKIEDIMMFYQVVKHGGFLKAAQENNICQGKISRRMNKLEEELGAQLFYHDMRQVIPTRAGKIVLKMAEDILETTTQAQLDIRNEYTGMAGPITVSAPSGFGNFWMMRLVVEFLQQYPDITIRFQMDHGLIGANTMLGEADITISTARPAPRASLHTEVLCEYPLYLYASQGYLDRKGMPQCAQDLDHHDFVGYNLLQSSHWTASVDGPRHMGRNPGDPRHAHIEVDSDLAVVMAVKEGAGLSLLPTFWAYAFPMIRRIDVPDVSFENYKNIKHISYLKDLKDSKRHKVLIDFIQEKAQSLVKSYEHA